MKNSLIILLVILSACNYNKQYTLADFVEIDKIENVHMRNSSGNFNLNKEQLKKFKKQITPLPYAPNMDLKGGAIQITLTIEGKTYYMTTRTHGEFIEIDPNLVTKNKLMFKKNFFKMNEINFDNYEPSVLEIEG